MAEPLLTHHDVQLRPDPARTVVRPFSPEYPGRFAHKDHPRAQVIVDRILGLPEQEFERQFEIIRGSLDERHRDVDKMLLDRFGQVCREAHLHGTDDISHDRKRLIGAYFSEEYSYEAAALFNPSAMIAPSLDDRPDIGVAPVPEGVQTTGEPGNMAHAVAGKIRVAEQKDVHRGCV